MNFFKLSSKAVARHFYEKGKSVFVLPCKMAVDNLWQKPYCLSKEQNFDKLINEYEYYNCNNEMGRYCSYYIKKGEV